MSRTRTELMTLIALLAVMCAQVFGVQAGFFCDCSGIPVGEAACEASCHPDLSHQHGCSGEMTSTHSDSQQAAPGAPDAPCGHQHRHRELRENLELIMAPLAAAVSSCGPAAFLPTFALPELPLHRADPVLPPGTGDPPETGSPPMPLLVARTIVMLV